MYVILNLVDQLINDRYEHQTNTQEQENDNQKIKYCFDNKDRSMYWNNNNLFHLLLFCICYSIYLLILFVSIK